MSGIRQRPCEPLLNHTSEADLVRGHGMSLHEFDRLLDRPARPAQPTATEEAAFRDLSGPAPGASAAQDQDGRLMGTAPGFDVMNVDVAIANDGKFKRLLRSAPELLPVAFMVYVSVLGESWKAAERVSVEDGWPSLLTFDLAVVEALQDASLLDKSGRIPIQSWRKRFTEANQRRLNARARWRRYNDKRGQPSSDNHEQTAEEPRGDDAASTSLPLLPSVPSVRPSVRRTHTPRVRARGNGHTEDPYDDGEFDKVVRWMGQRKAWADSPKLQTDLARIVDRKGAATVIAAMEALPDAEDAAQLIYGARNALFPLPGSVKAGTDEPDPAAVRAQLRQRQGPARA